MSLRTNKDNIFVFSPELQNTNRNTTNWNTFMEKDFTIVVDLKIDLSNLVPNQVGYFISRNGEHAGLSYYMDEMDNVHLMCTYYFHKKDLEKSEYLTSVSIEKQLTYCMLPEERDKLHTFVIRCDDTSKKIYYYMDSKLLGEINYIGLEKKSYITKYMFLGCGSMLSDNDRYKCIGNHEYYFLMCLNKCISIDEIMDLKNNYKEKYYEDYFGFPILKESTPHKENINIFMDFEYVNDYKIWNSSFNGCIPNFYIKDNTIY